MLRNIAQINEMYENRYWRFMRFTSITSYFLVFIDFLIILVIFAKHEFFFWTDKLHFSLQRRASTQNFSIFSAGFRIFLIRLTFYTSFYTAFATFYFCIRVQIQFIWKFSIEESYAFSRHFWANY